MPWHHFPWGFSTPSCHQLRFGGPSPWGAGQHPRPRMAPRGRQGPGDRAAHGAGRAEAVEQNQVVLAFWKKCWAEDGEPPSKTMEHIRICV